MRLMELNREVAGFANELANSSLPSKKTPPLSDFQPPPFNSQLTGGVNRYPALSVWLNAGRYSIESCATEVEKSDLIEGNRGNR